MEPLADPAPKGPDEKDYGETNCSICLEIMMDPVETNCKHSFCSFCLAKQLLGPTKRCAMCRGIVTKVTERTELKTYIEEKLVSALDEGAKKERDEELASRKTNKDILVLGDKPFERLLNDFTVGNDGHVYHYVRNESGLITDTIVTYNGDVLPRFALRPMIYPSRLRFRMD